MQSILQEHRVVKNLSRGRHLALILEDLNGTPGVPPMDLPASLRSLLDAALAEQGLEAMPLTLRPNRVGDLEAVRVPRLAGWPIIGLVQEVRRNHTTGHWTVRANSIQPLRPRDPESDALLARASEDITVLRSRLREALADLAAATDPKEADRPQLAADFVLPCWLVEGDALTPAVAAATDLEIVFFDPSLEQVLRRRSLIKEVDGTGYAYEHNEVETPTVLQVPLPGLLGDGTTLQTAAFDACQNQSVPMEISYSEANPLPERVTSQSGTTYLCGPTEHQFSFVNALHHLSLFRTFAQAINPYPGLVVAMQEEIEIHGPVGWNDVPARGLSSDLNACYKSSFPWRDPIVGFNQVEGDAEGFTALHDGVELPRFGGRLTALDPTRG